MENYKTPCEFINDIIWGNKDVEIRNCKGEWSHCEQVSEAVKAEVLKRIWDRYGKNGNLRRKKAGYRPFEGTELVPYIGEQLRTKTRGETRNDYRCRD